MMLYSFSYLLCFQYINTENFVWFAILFSNRIELNDIMIEYTSVGSNVCRGGQMSHASNTKKAYKKFGSRF